MLPNAFDSHIIFAAAAPFRDADGRERVYYMGGNGPHTGARNSSFALATLRPDGFASIRGSGRMITRQLLVTGAQVRVHMACAYG